MFLEDSFDARPTVRAPGAELSEDDRLELAELRVRALRAEKEGANVGGLQATQMWAGLNDAVIAWTRFHLVSTEKEVNCADERR